MNNNLSRIKKEYEILNNSEKNIEIVLINNDFKHWKGIINGPEDSVYEGGKFQIDIIIPEKYPYNPPKMKFDTKIWHPNISSQTGVICLDILKDEWTPALSIRTALLSLQVLMVDPQPNDPQDAVVAKEYIENRNKFNTTAKQWTKTYANLDNFQKQKIKEIMDMGFDEKTASECLKKNGWDKNLAIEELVGN